MFETLQLLISQSNKVYGIEFKELLKVLNRAWLCLDARISDSNCCFECN
jgi:hypothetical protein